MYAAKGPFSTPHNTHSTDTILLPFLTPEKESIRSAGGDKGGRHVGDTKAGAYRRRLFIFWIPPFFCANERASE